MTNAKNEKAITSFKAIVKYCFGSLDIKNRYMLEYEFSQHNRFRNFPMANRLNKIVKNQKTYIAKKRYDMAQLFDKSLLNNTDILPSELSINAFINYLDRKFFINRKAFKHTFFYATDFLRESYKFRQQICEEVYRNPERHTSAELKSYNRLYIGSFSLSIQCLSYFECFFAELSDEDRCLLINDIEQVDIFWQYMDTKINSDLYIGEEEWAFTDI